MKKGKFYDYPEEIETENLRAGYNTDKKLKGKINIGKNEEIYEIRVYPFRFEEGEVKFLSKIDKKTKDVTFVMVTDNIITKEQKGPVEKYRNFVKKFENDLNHVADIENVKVLSFEDILRELKGER